MGAALVIGVDPCLRSKSRSFRGGPFENRPASEAAGCSRSRRAFTSAGASKLGAHLTSEDRARLARPPTRNAQAYDFCLRGLDYWQRSIWEIENIKLAAVALEQAAAADPAFALAHARLGIAWTELYFMEADRDPTLEAKAKEEVVKH